MSGVGGHSDGHDEDENNNNKNNDYDDIMTMMIITITLITMIFKDRIVVARSHFTSFDQILMSF